MAQLHCSPSASGSVNCYDAQKGGAPVLKVEPNLFGGYDLRQSDGKLVRCETCSRPLVTTARITDPEIAVLESHLRACCPSEPLGDAPPLGEVMRRVRVTRAERA